MNRSTLVLAALAVLCGGVGQAKAGFLLPGDLSIVVCPAVVPGPSTFALAGVGAVIVAVWCWRRRR
jgi:hypothetical protein